MYSSKDEVEAKADSNVWRWVSCSSKMHMAPASLCLASICLVQRGSRSRLNLARREARSNLIAGTRFARDSRVLSELTIHVSIGAELSLAAGKAEMQGLLPTLNKRCMMVKAELRLLQSVVSQE